ncbi:MAG: DNA internalization-related competence protein ComEC/Rec2 [Gemmatimonadota bacterium]
MGAFPPVALLAMAVAAGAATALFAGGALPPALVIFAGLAALIHVWTRPASVWGVLGVAFAVGLTRAAVSTPGGPCERLAGHGTAVVVSGRFLAPTSGRGAPLSVTDPPCPGRTVYVVTRDTVAAGRPVSVRGRWRDGSRGGGLVLATEIRPGDDLGGKTLRWLLVRWRGGLVERLERLYGARAPLVAALTLARKEGLDPDLREAFVRVGIAHLLAISGFHVGVVAAVLLMLLRRGPLSRRGAQVAASVGTWAYVALLGFPDAAFRAALILLAVALSRARGRPPARWGALGSALLILTVLGPDRLRGPGFQLSFAGAAGLVAWSWSLRQRLKISPLRRLGPGLTGALAAGIAATAGTLPVVAWHFERVSLVGLPVTVAAAPLVALALPGALASLAADFVHPTAGSFLAGGVDLLLRALELGTTHVARLDWASVWIPRSWVAVTGVAGLLGARAAWRPGVRRKVRRCVALAWAIGAVVAWPVLVSFQARGVLEIAALDVGQGDALAIRTPRGRWMLVDAGPPGRYEGAGNPVVRALRRRGVDRIEMLVLTHPDLDHIGGAKAVLTAFDVGWVMDPSLPAGKESYVQVLETAVERRVPWRRALPGQTWEMDGVIFQVLHPAVGSPNEADAGAVEMEANDASVVIWLQYGAFDALLTGDAPVAVERRISRQLHGEIEVLKVAHHGSATSTDSLLLARADPHVALVSVGRGNRYGHPDPEVLARLRRAGIEVRRTDREGTLRVRARADGSFTVTPERPFGR